MKLEDIKNMSDEEFIELVKKAIKEEKEAKEDLPDNVIRVSPKKFKRILRLNRFGEVLTGAAIGGLSAQVIAIISMELGASNDKATIIAGISWPVVTAIWILGTHNDEKRQKKIDDENFERRKVEIETELKNNILNLKKQLESLTDEDFELLIENVKVLEQNKINNDIINSSNVLLAANQLIELNATDILSEFETNEHQDKYNENYIDDTLDMGYSKNMRKNN